MGGLLSGSSLSKFPGAIDTLHWIRVLRGRGSGSSDSLTNMARPDDGDLMDMDDLDDLAELTLAQA